MLHSFLSRRTTRTALTLVLRRRSCDRVGDPPRPRTSLAHVAVVAPAKGRNSPSRLINCLSGSALAAPPVADGPLIRRLINGPGSALGLILRFAGDGYASAGSALSRWSVATVGVKRPAPPSLRAVSRRLASGRESSSLPCHRRVTFADVHDRRALTLLKLRGRCSHGIVPKVRRTSCPPAICDSSGRCAALENPTSFAGVVNRSLRSSCPRRRRKINERQSRCVFERRMRGRCAGGIVPKVAMHFVCIAPIASTMRRIFIFQNSPFALQTSLFLFRVSGQIDFRFYRKSSSCWVV